MQDGGVESGWKVGVSERGKGWGVPHLAAEISEGRFGAGDIGADGRRRNRDGGGWEVVHHVSGDDGLEHMDS